MSSIFKPLKEVSNRADILSSPPAGHQLLTIYTTLNWNLHLVCHRYSWSVGKKDTGRQAEMDCGNSKSATLWCWCWVHIRKHIRFYTHTFSQSISKAISNFYEAMVKYTDSSRQAFHCCQVKLHICGTYSFSQGPLHSWFYLINAKRILFWTPGAGKTHLTYGGPFSPSS